MKRLYTTSVHVPIWNWDIVLFDGDDQDRFADILNDIGIDDECDAHAQGHAWVHTGKPIVIWVHTRDDFPTLAHEVMHAIFGMLDQRGLRHTSESEEAYTYTVSFVLNAALNQRWQRVTRNMRLKS
jgi:hypothetical protein